jgi:hypothetical protein
VARSALAAAALLALVALAATARAESAVVEYAAGDLVVIDSYRLHQIQPFSGDRDRLSVTAHLIFTDGRWQAWF